MLLLKQPVAAECYNDIDDRIVGFFRVLRDPEQSAELQRRASLTPYARAELEWAFGEPIDAIDAAHRLLVRSFMGHGSDSATRTTRTGFRARLTQGRGLPSHEWATWADSIPAFRERLAGVLLDNDNALRVIDRMDSRSTLIYCDPPYVHSTRSAMSGRTSTTNGYRHEMTDADHEALAARLLRVDGMAVVSGYPCELYDDMFAGWTTAQRRHVADTGKFRTEKVWLNEACTDALASARGCLFAGAV